MYRSISLEEMLAAASFPQERITTHLLWQEDSDVFFSYLDGDEARAFNECHLGIMAEITLLLLILEAEGRSYEAVC